MTERVALIAGASGHVGSQLVTLLAADANWQVLTLSRSPQHKGSSATHVSSDLLRGNIAAALSKVPKVTHVFYCVRAPHNESGKEDVSGNLLMLQRLVKAVERQNPALAHVHIVEGGKWYGAHLGPYKVPAEEDDPRHEGANFYHNQEDWLRARQPGTSWTWSASRPSFVCGVTPRHGRNMISTLGAYAAICREQGLPLHYPGSEKSFYSLTEVTEGALFARAMRFLATEPSAANQAFNVTNGDWFRWSEIWPELAQFFGLRPGIAKPLRLVEWSAGRDTVWASIVARYGLEKTLLEEVANWAFADFFIGQNYDVASSVRKIHSIGFTDTLESKKIIFATLAEYRRMKLLP